MTKLKHEELMGEFKEKIINGIRESISKFNEEDKCNLVEWVFDEYRNFMVTGRESYILTLDNVINGKYKGKELFKFLRENIGSYESTKYFFFAAQDILIDLKDGK